MPAGKVDSLGPHQQHRGLGLLELRWNYGDSAQNRSVAGGPSLTQACFAPIPLSIMIWAGSSRGVKPELSI
jgi:hypothetical protein